VATEDGYDEFEPDESEPLTPREVSRLAEIALETYATIKPRAAAVEPEQRTWLRAEMAVYNTLVGDPLVMKASAADGTEINDLERINELRVRVRRHLELPMLSDEQYELLTLRGGDAAGTFEFGTLRRGEWKSSAILPGGSNGGEFSG
jgi:hypothetical protein